MINKLKSLAIIIPAYNEETNIGKVIKSVLPYAFVIVVNDGSFDKTKKIVNQSSAYRIDHKNNRGYDQSIYAGLKTAKNLGFEFAITFDADGQHQAKYIRNIYKELINGSVVVVGSRNKFQRQAEKFFSSVSNALWKIDDPLSGMKGYNLKKINKYFYIYRKFNSIGTGILIKALKDKLFVSQIKITTNERKDKSRFGIGILPNLKILFALVRCLLL